MVSANIPTSSYILSSGTVYRFRLVHLHRTLEKGCYYPLSMHEKIEAQRIKRLAQVQPEMKGKDIILIQALRWLGPETGSSYTTPEKWKKKISSRSCLQIAHVKFLLYPRFFLKS